MQMIKPTALLQNLGKGALSCGAGGCRSPPSCCGVNVVTDPIGWAEFPTRELRAGTDVQ